MKEIKEILLPARCEAISAISALSAGHYYLMRIVFYCPNFYCPAEIKEIFVPTREAFLLFLQFLRDLKHASGLDLFYYPKEMKEIKEILLPARRAKPFCYFCYFCGKQTLPRENRIIPKK